MIDEQLIKNAEKGDSQAQNKLGLAYRKNEDYKEAEYWLKKSANQGYDEAQANLASMYFCGEPESIKFNETRIYAYDDNQGIEWLTKAAEQGNPEFQYGVARHWLKDKPKIFKYWATLSAEQGFIEAQSYLGWEYYFDVELEKAPIEDIKIAIYWTTLAANQDDSGCKNFLNNFYLKGEKNIQDQELALIFKEAGELTNKGHYDEAEKIWNHHDLWKHHKPNLEL